MTLRQTDRIRYSGKLMYVVIVKLMMMAMAGMMEYFWFLKSNLRYS